MRRCRATPGAAPSWVLRLGVHLRTAFWKRALWPKGSRGLFAGFSKEAALSSPPPHLRRKPGVLRSLSLCLCLSLSWSLSASLPTTKQGEGRCPRPPCLPTPAPTRPPWSTAEAAAASSASTEQQCQHQGKERGTKDAGSGVPAKLSTGQQLEECPKHTLGEGVRAGDRAGGREGR